MTDQTEFLTSLADEFLEDGYWQPDSIAINGVEITHAESLLIQGLQVAAEKPSWFRRFEVRVPSGQGPSPDRDLVHFEEGPRLDSEELQAVLDDVANPEDYTGQVQQHFSDRNYEEAVSGIKSGIASSGELEIAMTINKEAVVSELCSNWEYDCSQENVQLWINFKTLMKWTGSTTAEEIIQTQFESRPLPYHVFLDYDGEMSELLGFVTEESMSSGEAINPHSCGENHEVIKQTFSDLFSGINSDRPSVSPSIFDTKCVREAYSGPFLTLSLMCLANRSQVDGNVLDVKTLTDRHHLHGEINFEEDLSFSSSPEALEEIYNLIVDIHEKDPAISLSHWRRAVATQCSTFSDVSSNRRSITHYAGFLQEESAKEELEQLQNTVEEVSELTRTIANSLSEASQNLTSDLQNVVIALLGAIVTNFVLILRYSEFYVLAPFSIAAISGILIFYYPMIQAKINNTEEALENRTADFRIYFSEIRSHVGERVFDLDKIVAQHESHLETAAETLVMARTTISRIYILMILLWFSVVAYGHLILTDISQQWLTSALTDIGIATTATSGTDLISVTVIISGIPASWIIYKSWNELNSFRHVFQKSEIPDEVEVSIPKMSKDKVEESELKSQIIGETGPKSYATYYPFVSMSLLLLIVFIAICRLNTSLGV